MSEAQQSLPAPSLIRPGSLALVGAGRKAFREVNREFDAVTWFGEPVHIAKLGPAIVAYLGFQAAGASSCEAPRRLALSEETVLFLGPRYGARTIIHELGHLASCGVEGLADGASEQNAKKVMEACFE